MGISNVFLNPVKLLHTHIGFDATQKISHQNLISRSSRMEIVIENFFSAGSHDQKHSLSGIFLRTLLFYLYIIHASKLIHL